MLGPLVAAVVGADDTAAGLATAADLATALQCERAHPRRGWGTAHWLAIEGRLDVSHGDAVFARAADGSTTLMCAILGGHPKLVDAIIGRWVEDPDGADLINAADVDGNTAVHVAVEAGAVAELKAVLMAPNTDADVANRAGLTPLRLAATLPLLASSKRAKVVEFLVAAGVPVYDGLEADMVDAGLSAATVACVVGPTDETATGFVTRAMTVAAVSLGSTTKPATPGPDSDLRKRLNSDPALSFIEAGDLVLGGELGSGGFGTVYHATLQVCI